MDRRHRYASLLALALPLAFAVVVCATGHPAALSSLAGVLTLTVTALITATIASRALAAGNRPRPLPVRVRSRAAYLAGRHEALPGDPDRPGCPSRPRAPGLGQRR